MLSINIGHWIGVYYGLDQKRVRLQETASLCLKVCNCMYIFVNMCVLLCNYTIKMKYTSTPHYVYDLYRLMYIHVYLYSVYIYTTRVGSRGRDGSYGPTEAARDRGKRAIILYTTLRGL